MQEFRGKRMMGHAMRRWGLRVKVKWKRIGKKKMQFSGLLFFFIDNWNWFICIHFCPDYSIVTKEDSQCRHIYVYIVHKVPLLSTTLLAVCSKNTPIKRWQKIFLGALQAGSTTFEHFCDERQTRFWDLLKNIV